ncbi:MAG TPA: hypothetical protein DEB25_01775 [Desulfobulbaceae bacterium]|nr:hypothetical protein [Desulfobulbaceae bacterium]
MNKTIFHRTRRWPLTAFFAVALIASLAPWPSQAAGLNGVMAAQTASLAQIAGQSVPVWIGAFPDGVVPMRPLEFIRQENGDLLIKGGAVVKAPPIAWWPVLRGGGHGYFFVLAPDNPRGGGAYWIMDFSKGN